MMAMSLVTVSCPPNKVESMCAGGYPRAAEECNLEIKMKKERTIYCGCEGDSFNLAEDFDGCRYVHTRGHDIYLCGGTHGREE